MKKIIICILTILLAVPVIGVFSSETLKAETINDYEVAYINDDGSFSTIGSYSTLDEAKNIMHSAGSDYVVRHQTSLSPSKIIAMNSGVVYTYPGRSGTNTMNIYQDASTRNVYYKQTYVSNHYEMRYIDTERYLPAYNGGIVEVELNGFKGFADLEYTDLVPDKFLNNGIGLYLGGNNNYEDESPFYIIPKRNYFSVEKNGNYLDLAFHYSRAYPEDGNNPLQYTIYLGQAPDFMKQGTKYYSSDGVNFYSDTYYSRYVGTYYNYYQFLPLRSKTKISGNIIDSYIYSKRSDSVLNGHGQDFIDEQEVYGVNGLLLLAMACQESAYGASAYAKQRNNLFGWNAVDYNAGNASYFSSVSACIFEQGGINIRGFIDITDGRFFSSSLGNKGSGINVKYASDPYWGMKIAAIAYEIDKYANGKNGYLTDYNNYSMSLINTFDIPVKASDNDSANTLYTTQYGPYYQKDFVVITLEEGKSFTKVQSTNAIDDNGNIMTHQSPPTTGDVNPIFAYDFNKSVAYIKNTYLEPLNGKAKEKEEEPGDLLSSVSKFEIVDNKLNIEGIAYIENISHDNLRNIKHTVIVKNLADQSIYKTYNATTYEKQGIDDGYRTYKYVGYKVAIPISDLKQGSYNFSISIKNGNLEMNNPIVSYLDKHANKAYRINDLTYHLTTNEYYNYRFELDVCSVPEAIDYSLIKKPSTRSSLFSFNNITIDEEANMTIGGVSMIYYLNYPRESSTTYHAYLVDDKNNYLELDCKCIKSTVNYKQILDSSFDLSCINFECNGNIGSLKDGVYSLILKIENGGYVDFVEMNSITHKKTPEVKIGEKNYRVFVSDIRDRLMLEVK